MLSLKQRPGHSPPAVPQRVAGGGSELVTSVLYIAGIGRIQVLGWTRLGAGSRFDVYPEGLRFWASRDSKSWAQDIVATRILCCLNVACSKAGWCIASIQKGRGGGGGGGAAAAAVVVVSCGL